MALAVGTVLAGYRVEAELGHGSTGSVYLAHDVALNRRVALKVLLSELARDERFRERFLAESRVAASLDHPHIVPIYAAGEVDGELYIAMRYVDGSDLEAVLEDGPIELERSLELLKQIADALDAAHARGLVHRDVKPANILVAKATHGEHAYLSDFGLAKHASTVASLTGDRAILGTVEYLAPEQVEGKPVDARTDVYALGCVLFQCLTGEPPFRRENEIATLLAHASEAPPRLTDRLPDAPVVLDDVLASALAKDREHRYATCFEFIDAVGAAARGESAVATSVRRAAVRTFLFGDIRGYTSYTREHGDEAGAKLANAFAEIVRELAPQHDGELLELRGDEVLVVFDSARAALRFGTALQKRLADGELARPVGIGIDCGEAVAVNEGYRGAALNRAARLCAIAKPGEVLVSDAVRELAGPTEGVVYGLRRLERLKGFERPVGVTETHPAERVLGKQLVRRTMRKLRGPRPRIRIGIAASVLVAVGAIVLVLSTEGATEHQLPANAIGLYRIDNGKPVTSVNPGFQAVGLVKDAGAFYALDPDASFLTRIDAVTHDASDQFPIPPSPDWLLWRTAFGSIWITDSHEPTLERIDPRYRQVVARIKLPLVDPAQTQQHAEGIAATTNAIWVAYGFPVQIARIDPETNQVTLHHGLPNGGAWGYEVLLAAQGNTLWAIARDGSHFARLDAQTGDPIVSGKLHNGWVEDAAVAGGYLWAPMQTDGGVWQIDPTGSVVGKIATGARPIAAVPDGGALWVPNANSGTVTRIDVNTGATKTFVTGHSPQGVGIAGKTLWVPLIESASELRGHIHGHRVLTLVAPGDPFFSTDPADYGGDTLQFALGHATLANLLAYRTARDGTAEVVPEIAAGPPRITDGGRTFDFRIRPGFKFSPPSNAPVTAQTVRFSLERALSPTIGNLYCSSLLSQIVGEAAYRAGKADHIAGITVSGTRLRIRLTTPMYVLPAVLTHPCFSVVPIGTPILPDGVFEPIPSAGPYYIDSHVSVQQLVMVRNPNYHGPRPQRLDAMVMKLDVDSLDAGRLVASGAADLTVDESQPPDPPFATGGEYDQRYGPASIAARAGHQRYFLPATGGTYFLALNTTRGPLRNLRYRRAIAYAVDRRSLAQAISGQPAQLMIPKGVPGYSSARPFSDRAQPARARALLRGAHPKLLLVASVQSKRSIALMPGVRDALVAAGFRVTTRLLADPEGSAKKPGADIDVLLDGWSADYPDPSDFLNLLFSPPSTGGAGFMPPFFTDSGWQYRLEETGTLVGAQRIRAYTKLDRELATGPIPYVALTDVANSPVLISKRVGCLTFLGAYTGIPDFGALCIR